MDIGTIITLVLFGVVFLGVMLVRRHWLLLVACGFMLMSFLPSEAISSWGKIGITLAMAWCFIWAIMLILQGESDA
ncbi:hypothetical protein [Dehalococcoides mccartyi]|uniref:hypothetical protein n=1 Tax=Dehalococcoides mccartyi TaxID=61435 RepID=UPI0003C87D69|nr:hypothetical protein [Dehalococcoides mccartyi]AHB12890.1 hypothetical protein GY50_0104 [Dehalococcoides mccartyi GY50]